MRQESLESFLAPNPREHDLTDVESRWVSYNLWDLYPDWQQDAHCAGVGNAYYFGDEEAQPTMSIKQVRKAAELCGICPVFTQCLTHALTQREEYGVWAGTSGRVRRQIFAALDADLLTVEDVVNHFLNGNGSFYKTLAAEAAVREGDVDEQLGVTGDGAAQAG